MRTSGCAQNMSLLERVVRGQWGYNDQATEPEPSVDVPESPTIMPVEDGLHDEEADQVGNQIAVELSPGPPQREVTH